MINNYGDLGSEGDSLFIVLQKRPKSCVPELFRTWFGENAKSLSWPKFFEMRFLLRMKNNGHWGIKNVNMTVSLMLESFDVEIWFSSCLK